MLTQGQKLATKFGLGVFTEFFKSFQSANFFADIVMKIKVALS